MFLADMGQKLPASGAGVTTTMHTDAAMDMKENGKFIWVSYKPFCSSRGANFKGCMRQHVFVFEKLFPIRPHICSGPPENTLGNETEANHVS